MIGTERPSTAPGFTAHSSSSRKAKTRTDDSPHDRIYVKTYARKAASPRPHKSAYTPESPESGCIHMANYQRIYDANGRQGTFRETASQRQERLDLVRRRERTRSQRALKYLRHPSSSGSAAQQQKRPATPRLQPVEAAIMIQRAYRAHRALSALAVLEQRIEAASDPSFDTRTVIPYLHGRAAELGVLGALLDTAPHMTDDPRLQRKSRHVTEMLCKTLDRAEFIAKAQRRSVIWVNQPCSGLIGGTSAVTLSTIEEDDSSESNYDDIIHNHWHGGKEHAENCDCSEHASSVPEGEWGWLDSSSSESDSSDEVEADYEFGTGVPETPDERLSEARRTAFDSLFSGSIQQQLWISRILRAPPLNKRSRRPSVSKVPTLLTISEDSELQL